MSKLVSSGSTNSIFLTEAKTRIDIPVTFTQHSLDDNPHFVDFLKQQTSRNRFVATTGMQPLGHDGETPMEVIQRLRNQRQINREKEQFRRDEEKRRANEHYQAQKVKYEDEKRLKREKTERLWRKDMDRLKFRANFTDYDEQLPIKPGYWFFKALLENEKYSAQGLKIRIPEMIYAGDHILWVRNDETEDGPSLKVVSEFRIIEFCKEFTRPADNSKRPVALLRVPGDKIENMKAIPLLYEEIMAKLNASQLPDCGLMQKYLTCRAEKLAVTRLFYYSESRSNASSYAYTLTATKAAEKIMYGDYILLAEQPGAVEIFPVSAGALREAIAEAQILIDFLQRAYSVRIDRIVLDFLKDESERLWLLSCKGVQLDPSSLVARELQLSQGRDLTTQEIMQLKKEQQNHQQSSVHCKLCLLPYKPAEAMHMLPFKMLLLFKRHTAHSGRTPFDLSHLRVNTMDFLSHWVRLCEICYVLVLHEYELMETEMNLANLLNIPARIPDLLNEPQVQQPNFMPLRMHQWRLLFYFHDLEFMDDPVDSSGIYLQYSLLSDKFCYLLEPSWLSGSRARYHITRLYYFFSGSNLDVKRFADSCHCQFRLTKGKDWDHVLAQGSLKPLSRFSCEMADCDAICQPLEVLLFKEDRLSIKAHMTVGLAKDREVKVRDMPISIFRVQGIYLPEQSYINSEPLPAAWMEVFNKEYKGLERTVLEDSSTEIEEMYTPNLTRKEMFGSPQATTHILHTKIDLDPFGRSLRRISSAKVRSPVTTPQYSLQRKALTRLNSAISHKSSKSHGSYPSLSTTSTSKVIYQLDSTSKLKSPTFISPRSFVFPDKSPKAHELLTNESIEELQALFPDAMKTEKLERAMSEEQLRDTVAQYLQKRCKSPELGVEKHKKVTRKGRSRQSSDLRRLFKRRKQEVIDPSAEVAMGHVQRSCAKFV